MALTLDPPDPERLVLQGRVGLGRLGIGALLLGFSGYQLEAIRSADRAGLLLAPPPWPVSRLC